MRELERTATEPDTPPAPRAASLRLAIVGIGRAGAALSRAASAAGIDVAPAGRDDAVEACSGADAALLSVPDREIGGAASALAAGLATAAGRPPRFAGHVSGASGLEPLEPLRELGAETFSMHPLQTLPGPDSALEGSWCAVSGATPAAARFAAELAERLGMRAFELADEARAAYHAAASLASNLLVALEEAAVELLEAAGVEAAREALTPLVLRTAANWADGGPDALTGPIARGDEATVAAHREAIAAAAPHLARSYDALAELARGIAAPGPALRGAGGDASPVPGGDAPPALGRDHRSTPLVARTRAELEAALASARAADRSIGLVPTMGFLHAGHRSLLAEARRRCDVVVMSLFVNPAQFRADEDLSAYPRDEQGDLAAAAEEGVDVVYAPPVEEVYPEGFATSVRVRGGLTEVLCGDPRRRGAEHFDGVTTVVAKLLAGVRPQLAFFGQKDAQQAIVIRRMVRDLELPVEIVALPTVREPDGLALSSRNAYLGPDDRERATALNRALETARGRLASGAELGEALAAARELLDRAGVEPEYLEARDAEDLSAVEALGRRPLLIATAARVGPARLIDNVIVGGSEPPPPTPATEASR